MKVHETEEWLSIRYAFLTPWDSDDHRADSRRLRVDGGRRRGHGR